MEEVMQDLRSPEQKAEAEAREAARERERDEATQIVREANKEFAGRWNPIETMPFAAYANYFTDRTVLLSDGSDVAVATVHKRFGRPLKVVNPGEMALTDHGISYVGVETEEYNNPEWWFEWEFTDELSDNHEMWGKDEVPFVATHWMPLPGPPNDPPPS